VNFSDVKWLHVEASTRCNAWCPACPRNINGYGLRPGLVEQDIDLAVFQTVLEQFPNLATVQFCGNDGEPAAHRDFFDLVSLTKQYVSNIQIHTNGGLRNEQWWRDLASLLDGTDHSVWFGIDGIGDTHEIYRQGTEYDRVLANALAFIDQGGSATWQFIPFQHNQHQLKECIKLSQRFGFKDFKVVKSFRERRAQARHWRSGDSFILEPADVYKRMFFKPKTGEVSADNCMHQSIPSVYVSANGQMSVCCYYSDQQYSTAETLLSSHTIDLTKPTAICQRACGS